MALLYSGDYYLNNASSLRYQTCILLFVKHNVNIVCYISKVKFATCRDSIADSVSSFHSTKARALTITINNSVLMAGFDVFIDSSGLALCAGLVSTKLCAGCWSWSRLSFRPPGFFLEKRHQNTQRSRVPAPAPFDLESLWG